MEKAIMKNKKQNQKDCGSLTGLILDELEEIKEYLKTISEK